jgi:urea transport system substrate-binding protein
MRQMLGAKFYLLGVDRVWPHKTFETADPVLSNIGATVVGKEYALGQEEGYKSLINRVSDSQANVLLLAWKGDGLEQFIAQASERALFIKWPLAFLGLSETGYR